MAEMNSSKTEFDNNVVHVFYPALINVVYSISAFVVTMILVPTTKGYFIKAGLKGKDMAKKDKREMYDFSQLGLHDFRT